MHSGSLRGWSTKAVLFMVLYGALKIASAQRIQRDCRETVCIIQELVFDVPALLQSTFMHTFA